MEDTRAKCDLSRSTLFFGAVSAPNGFTHYGEVLRINLQYT